MPLLPPLMLLTVTVGLGVYLASRYLQGQRNRPALVAIHLLPGIGALELIALLLHGAPDGTTPMTTGPGKAAALMVMLALLVGFLAPALLRERPRSAMTAALALHALCGLSAFVLLAVWAAGR